MAETYSLASVGVPAGQTPYTLALVQLPDSAARAQPYTAQKGSQILCKRPDGSQAWFTIDAERSIPGQPPVLKAVSP